MAPSVEITTSDIMNAIGKTIVEKWKFFSVIAVFAAALFFAGGWYVYKDAQARTADVMIQLYEDVDDARKKLRETMDEIDAARENLKENSERLERNFDALNEALESAKALQEEVNERKKSNDRNEKLNEELLKEKPQERIQRPTFEQYQPLKKG